MFPGPAREGSPLGGEYHGGAGYVTIEDLLSHFFGGMTGLGAGAGGGGPMGDYVLSDGESLNVFAIREMTDAGSRRGP